MSTSLIRRVLAFTSGNVFYMGGQFVLLVLLARLGTPALVGAYSLSTALLNPIFYFTKLGMQQAQATEHADEFPFAVYMRLRMLFLIAAVGLGLAIAVAMPEESLRFVFFVVLAAKAIEAMSDIYYGLLLRHERQAVIGVSLSLRALLCVLSFLVLYWVTNDAAIALVGMPVGWALIFFLHDRLRTRDIVGAPIVRGAARRDVGRLLALLWPLALVGFLGQAGQGLPRYLVAWEAGAAALAHITPALQLHVMVGTLAQSVSQSLLPGVARDIAAGEARRAWRRMARLSLALSPLLALGSAICFAFGPWLIRLVFGPGYEMSGVLLGVASLSWSFRAVAMLFQNVVVGGRNFRKMLRLQTLVFALTGAVLIPLGLLYGVPGAIWGMVGGSALQLGVFVLQSWRESAGPPG